MNKKEAIEFLKEEFNITPHEKMVYRGLREARERVIGSEKEQYRKIRGYLIEITRSNPRSTALLEVIPIPQQLPVFDK
ncbi:hypothetical protein PIB30_114173, partial [Stylosanthes scabra]|nr:hypothetical protein [Stylosanthes scabra]MED6191241.1 hypothetical protein [Stylosanthes scabra]